jgi:CDP-glycerol glycerophosphotransferase (TagB/SpsB family)
MLEVDVLLNDYSTTSTDFAILNRPQLFFMPDYDYYHEDCGFLEDYKQLLPGKEVRSQDELIKGLEYIFSQKNDYLDSYKDKKKELLEKYYDINQRNSSENFHSFITEVLDT